MLKTRKEIDTWIYNNYRRLSKPEYMFSLDNRSQSIEEFYNAKLRVLVVFLSPGSRRTVSNTFVAIAKQSRMYVNKEDVFLDYCYFPEFDNLDILDKEEVPYIFGAISHAPITDFDIMMVSLSTFHESVNYPRMLMKSDIPLTIEQREKREDIPLIFFGGAISSEASIFYGPVYDKDNNCLGKSLVDICQYGNAEKVMPEYIKVLVELKEKGYNLRKDKAKVIEYLIDNKVCHDYLFYVKYYEWVYDKDNFTIKEIKKLDDRVPDRVKINRTTDDMMDYIGWDNKILSMTGDNLSNSAVQISSGCTGQCNTCSFCHEGTIAGGYKEVPLSIIKHRIRENKKYTAIDSSYPFAYNLNYYSRFLDLNLEQSKQSRNLALINERLDVIAHDDTPLKLAKSLNLFRFSGAIEGIGPRIRNEILNKNLSSEDLILSMKNILSVNPSVVKCGLIKTGYETKEDVDDFMNELDIILSMRGNSRTMFQVNITPLIIYSQVALRYLERRSAIASYKGLKDMTYLLLELRKRHIRCKGNARGIGSYVEQLVIDFGPAGTDWLVESSCEGLLYNISFTDKHREIVLNNLTKRGYDHLFFTHQRPFDNIFPNDHIIYATDNTINHWIECTKKMNFNTSLCLKTPANVEPKCHNCKACDTKEDILSMVNRDISNNHTTIEDITKVLSEKRDVDVTRIVYQVNPKYDFISKDTLNHYITSLFLEIDDTLVDSLNTVDECNYSTKGAIKGNLDDWFSGNITYDIIWNKKISRGYLDKYIEEVNKKLVSSKVVKIIYNVKDLPLSNKDTIAYLGVIKDMKLTDLQEKLVDFDWNIKIFKTARASVITKKEYMPELKDRILVVPNKKDLLVYMYLPYNVNPYIVLSSMMNKPYKKVREITTFSVVGQFKEIDSTCKCGNSLVYSYTNDTYSKVCLSCLGRVMLKNIIKK